MSATGYTTYQKVDVETASQGKLIVMLFDGAIRRAEEAKRQMGKGKLSSAHNNLVRAQEIIAVLASRKEIPQFKPASPFGRPAGADVLSQSGVPAAE